MPCPSRLPLKRRHLQTRHFTSYKHASDHELPTLTDADIAKVAGAYHTWREKGGRFAAQAGFSKAATTEEIAAQGYVLTPGRYVGTAEVEEDDEPFEAKMARLTATLREQMAEGVRLDEQIRRALAGVGHGW
jgi:type I restriction enzyme M protein